jgi:hypothetical protein
MRSLACFYAPHEFIERLSRSDLSKRNGFIAVVTARDTRRTSAAPEVCDPVRRPMPPSDAGRALRRLARSTCARSPPLDAGLAE